jgi:cytochrome c2
MPTEQHCTHCHEDISTGRFGAGTPKIGEWRRSVAPYRYAPSLDAIGKRFRRDWLTQFLGKPYDLRPHLAATMPRLAVSQSQAEDLAAYLTRDAPPETRDAATGNAVTGRALMEQKGCGGCHEFSGVPPLPSTPNPTAANEALRRAISLAPDLRHTRERFRPDALAAWLLDPSAVKPGTPMPSHGFVPSEARDVAAYVLHAELTPVAAVAPRERLPILSHPVTYREVSERVFSITCRHCHGDADAAGGDGGPGNTGGFGFSPRRLDLSDYRGTNAGLVGDDGERHSIFEKDSSGVPLLVSALVRRQNEETGGTSELRGMPLGLPAVSAEDVQLVESWIAQGRPR